MAKDPAFLFYPNDYIGGTMGMTFEEKGAYMELLMTQFNRGHMTSQVIEQVLGHTFGRLWVTIKDKFIIDGQGLYYNERLDMEKSKRKNFTESRRNNVLGKNQHTKTDGHKPSDMTKHIGGHMTSHMENENINENKEIIKKDENEKSSNKKSDFMEKLLPEHDDGSFSVSELLIFLSVPYGNILQKMYEADLHSRYVHFSNLVIKKYPSLISCRFQVRIKDFKDKLSIYSDEELEGALSVLADSGNFKESSTLFSRVLKYINIYNEQKTAKPSKFSKKESNSASYTSNVGDFKDDFAKK